MPHLVRPIASDPVELSAGAVVIDSTVVSLGAVVWSAKEVGGEPGCRSLRGEAGASQASDQFGELLAGEFVLLGRFALVRGNRL
jgi:hypothetical protein